MANVLDQIGSNIKKKIEENKKMQVREVVVDSKNELLVIENTDFNYNELEKDLAEFLKGQELQIKDAISKTYTEIGEILLNAQEKLSHHHKGIFESWYESLGFKKDKVYRLISRYKLVLANCENRKIIENLPLSLSYEISKESCLEELRNKVLSGEIKTLKEFNIAKGLKEDSKVEEFVPHERLKDKIHDFEVKYEKFRRSIFENFNDLEDEKRNKLFKEIKKIEKKIECILEDFS